MSADWSDDSVHRLKVLWAQGFSAAQIRDQLRNGATRSAIIGKVHRLGLPKRAEPNRSYAGAALARKRKVSVRPVEPAVMTKLKYSEPAWKAASRPRRPPLHIERPNAVRFIDREPSQCAFFLEGEEGAQGFVCGEPVALNQWCADCARLAYQPAEKRKAA